MLISEAAKWPHGILMLLLPKFRWKMQYNLTKLRLREICGWTNFEMKILHRLSSSDWIMTMFKIIPNGLWLVPLTVYVFI